MDAVPPTPRKPGWYWDPRELEFNLALRERWRRQVMYLAPENMYRLRRWDGLNWTDDTLRSYYARGVSALPWHVGATTRMYPLTPAQNKRRWKFYWVAMTLATIAAVLLALLT